MFGLIRKIRLISHLPDIHENEINPDQSLLKLKSICTPLFTKRKECEDLIRNLSNISLHNTYSSEQL